MNEPHWYKDLKHQFEFFSKQIICGLIDSSFLALWVIIQWGVNKYVIERLELSGVDKFALLALQVIFATSTLAFIVTHIYTSVRIMILKAQREIEREMKLSKADKEKNSDEVNAP